MLSRFWSTQMSLHVIDTLFVILLLVHLYLFELDQKRDFEQFENRSNAGFEQIEAVCSLKIDQKRNGMHIRHVTTPTIF